MKQKIIIANWKMNGNQRFCHDFMKQLCGEWPRAGATYEITICPPFPYLPVVASYVNRSGLSLGAQNCAEQISGAFTGDVSAQMLRDMSCKYVLIGHSERRQHHDELNHVLANKLLIAQQSHLIPVLCVGEGSSERNNGSHLYTVSQQLLACLPQQVDQEKLAIAYEPIWAIGSGRVANLPEIAEMHECINQVLNTRFGSSVRIPILYGGSVNPQNARDIINLKEVGGVLVGGASLKINDFLQIISV